MCRAAVLAQPDDMQGFLCTHLDNMNNSRETENTDIKEMMFDYQEQWGEYVCNFHFGFNMNKGQNKVWGWTVTPFLLFCLHYLMDLRGVVCI